MSALCAILEDPYTSVDQKRLRVGRLLSERYYTWLDNHTYLDPVQDELVNGFDLRHGYFPLLIAATLRDCHICRLLIGYGATIDNCVQEEFFADHVAPTVLHQACLDGNLELVTLIADQKGEGGCHQDFLHRLIQKRNFKGQTPLHLAAESGNMQLLVYLKERCSSSCDWLSLDDFGNSALHCAILSDSQQMAALIEFLLAEGLHAEQKNTNGTSPLMIALFYELLEARRTLIKSLPEERREMKWFLKTIFEYSHCDKDIVEVVEKNISFDALMKSADVNEIVSVLVISCKADLLRHFLAKAEGCKELCLNKPHFMGHAPLSLACKEQCDEIISLLLDHRANPNIPTTIGTRPLDKAILNRHVSAVNILLMHGADCRRSLDSFSNALFLGSFDIAKKLLKAGLRLDTTKNSQYNWVKVFDIHQVSEDFLEIVFASGHFGIFRDFVGPRLKKGELWSLMDLYICPPSLSVLSAVTIRQILQPNVLAVVKQLPLPAFLQKKLLLEL